MKPHIHLTETLLEIEGQKITGVVTCGDPKRAATIAAQLDKMKPLRNNREYASFAGLFKGKPVLVLSHGVGSAGAAIAFQEVIDLGIKRLIRVGTSGGLQDDLPIGSVVVANAAVRQEGLTARMLPLEYPAVSDPMLSMRVFQNLQARAGEITGHGFGTVVTSDLFYPGLLDGGLPMYRDAGCLAVEMEVSALYVIASLRKVQASAVLAVDGNPLKWNEGNYAPGSDAVKKALNVAIEVALESI